MGTFIPDPCDFDIVTQNELDEIIKKHKMFMEGSVGGARASLKFKNLRDLNFRNSNMSGADFTGSKMENCNLSNGIYEGACFFACDLRNANLEKANFTRADFRGAFVAGANLEHADLEKADLRSGSIVERDAVEASKGSSYLSKTSNKKRTIFTGARLTDTNMSGARAHEADFSDANMSGVVMQDADFRDATFEGAILNDANFTGSDLRGSNMKNTVMLGTVLEHAEVRGLDTEGAVKEPSSPKEMEEVKEKLPEMLNSHKSWVESAGTNGAQLDLSEKDLTRIDNLSKYPLTAIRAVKASFRGLNLMEVKMQSARLDFSDFRDVDLTDSDSRGTSFRHCDFSRAILKKVNLGPLVFKNPDGSKRYQNVDMSESKLVYSNLENSDLRRINLSGSNLAFCNFSGADLREADLRGTNLDGARFEGADMEDALLDDGVSVQ